MDAKRITAIVLSVILLAALAFSITWGVINFNKVKDGLSGSGLYTQDDVTSAYDDGYNTALDNKQEYEDLIAEYRDKLSDYELIKKELVVSKDNIDGLNDKVFELKNYIAECESLIDKMKAENYQLSNQIKNLENINANLLQSVNAYIQFIASISIIEERYVVTFMFDDTVYSILLVPDGNKVEIENPVSTEYTIFLGWSLSQDGELIDLNEIKITADTVIYAKIIRKYDVNFILDYEIYEHHIIEKGDTITATTPPSTNRRMFKGWSLDGVNVIDITDFPINEHRNFFAVVENRYEVKFVYTRHSPYLSTTTLRTQYVGKSDTVGVPNPPQFSGYRFDGWLLNGVTRVSDPSTYKLTSDAVFVAKYVANSVTVSNPYRFGSNGMFSQFNILSYLSNNGHGYVRNMQMLKTFNVVVRVYAGSHNGATYNLNQNNFSVYRVPCWGINEWYAKGTLFYSVGLLANGYLQLQLTFEGSSMLNNSMFSGCTLEIVSVSFTLNDF